MKTVIMNKILLYNYSLSVYFSRGKKNLIKRGTWFLLANELFFLSVSFVFFLITQFNIKMSREIIFIFYLLIWYFTFYGIKNWVYSQLETKKIDVEYKAIKQKALETFFGLLFFIGSFLTYLIIVILFFQGYLNIS
jgi:uncharacterized membrane protein